MAKTSISYELVKKSLKSHPKKKGETMGKYVFRLYDGLAHPKQKKKKLGNGTVGKVFEYLIQYALLDLDIDAPLYAQASITQAIPDVKYDFIYFSEKSPEIISAKTSLRERWKGAELEARAAKAIYPSAHCVLITANREEIDRRKRDKEEGKILSLDDFVCVDGSGEFDVYLKALEERSGCFSEAGCYPALNNAGAHVAKQLS